MIAVSDLEFHFSHSDFSLAVPSLNIATGERVALIGPSGSGKTTLLHLIAGILSPARGRIRLQDREVNSLNDAARREFRVAHIGLVFQNFELVSYLDVFDNILLPCRLNPALRLTPDRTRRAEQLARETGIEHRLRYFPHRLSQGEKQRVALCRALLPEPPLLLADEPTGNLDPLAKQRVVDLLFQQVERRRATLLMVTHDPEIAARFPRVLNCRDFARGAP
ncbi:Lipoprotein-releasing system ATP-binding protein LolD [Verrucomicrobia bacterium]|nr:Lipoprotein-releasing system ATP-binding protein LolD [Verrucomicrobiota bacterium]